MSLPHHRWLLLLATALAALALASATAVASEPDEDDEDDGDVPAQVLPVTPVPATPAPAPAGPVTSPPVTSPPVTTPPVTSRPVVRGVHRTRRQPTRLNHVQRSVLARHVVRTTAHQRAGVSVVPRGGVQAGAGGMAPRDGGSPLGLAASGLVLLGAGALGARRRRLGR